MSSECPRAETANSDRELSILILSKEDNPPADGRPEHSGKTLRALQLLAIFEEECNFGFSKWISHGT